MGAATADFSGYATMANVKCSDGRTIMNDAFKHQDKIQVPLVWQHMHGDSDNILGYAILEHRDNGVYCHGYFNETPKGQNAKLIVKHGDVDSLSVYANKLVEKAGQVFHGFIREVSLVLNGANPGAKIDYIAVQHSDDPNDVTTMDDEAIIYSGESIKHSDDETEDAETEKETVEEGEAEKKSEKDDSEDKPDEEGTEETIEHADGDDDEETVQDVYDTLTDKQKAAVSIIVDSAIQSDDVEHTDKTNEGDLTHTEGTTEMTNVFEANGVEKASGPSFTHSQVQNILARAKEDGSFRKAFMEGANDFIAHAEEYGIEDINLLFPDARAVTNTPEWVARRMEWVAKVLDGTKHTPFAKIKSLSADITEDEARAKGYIKGNQKKDEVFKLLARTTGPATVYKKQKLDRDDIVDITDFDVVLWLLGEMRLMIEEELARAILIGDGRASNNPDKIKDPEGATDGVGIRSILHDSDFYAHKVELAANVSPNDAVKGIVRARSKYRGTGKPTFFVSDTYLTDIMLEEDKFGRPLYETEQSLKDKLRVESIVTVDLFDDIDDVFGILVNLADYTIGTNKGGELTNFDDFDIDFNQFKYLIETRLSGALTKYKSAVVIRRGTGTSVTPTAPSFNGTTKVITIPATTGVIYSINDVTKTGAQPAITETTEVEAEPATGYYFPAGTTTEWTYSP